MENFADVLQQTKLFTLPGVLIVAAILFGIGCIGVVLKRNIIVILMSVEVILNAINLAILAFGLWPIPGLDGSLDTRIHLDSQYFVLIVIAVAAVEAAIGLAILVSVFRTRRQVDTRSLEQMEG